MLVIIKSNRPWWPSGLSNRYHIVRSWNVHKRPKFKSPLGITILIAQSLK